MSDARGNGTGVIAPDSLPLERKLPLLVLGLFTLVLATSLIISYYEERRSAIETAGARLATLGQAFAAMTEQGVNQRLGLLRRASHDTAVVHALRTPAQPLSSKAIQALGTLYVTAADTATPPELWDARGQPLGDGAHGLEAPEDEHHVRDELIQAAAAGEAAHVTRLRATNGRASYYIGVPVRDSSKLLGFVGQERRINFNPRALSSSVIRGLLGADLDFFFRNVGDNTWIRLTGATAPPPTNVQPALDSLQRYSRGAAGQMLSSTTAVPGTPLLITVERPMAAILARPLATIRLLIAISILLAMLGAFAVWLLSRRLVRPLGDLTRAAEAMARGRYGERVVVGTGDEIGRLGSAFNRMAAEVQTSPIRRRAR